MGGGIKASGTRRGTLPVTSDINVTSLVDVAFVLLIYGPVRDQLRKRNAPPPKSTYSSKSASSASSKGGSSSKSSGSSKKSGR